MWETQVQALAPNLPPPPHAFFCKRVQKVCGGTQTDLETSIFREKESLLSQPALAESSVTPDLHSSITAKSPWFSALTKNSAPHTLPQQFSAYILKTSNLITLQYHVKPPSSFALAQRSGLLLPVNTKHNNGAIQVIIIIETSRNHCRE